MEGKRPPRHRAALIAIWGLATVLGLVVAATTRIGPILLTISARHGVHLGDLLAFGAAYAAAALMTFRPPSGPLFSTRIRDDPDRGRFRR